MKRGHNIDNKYVRWLKSLGCILYLPLSADGDLQDRISGLDMQTTGGSMVWSDADEMYLFTTPSTYPGKCGVINSSVEKSTFSENNTYTVMGHMKMITNDSSKYQNLLSPNATSWGPVESLTLRYSGTGNTGSWPHDKAYDVATVCYLDGSFKYDCYVDGVFNIHTDNFFNECIPSNWSVNGNGIFVGVTHASNRCSVQYYVKEIYLFNTALDLATIRKIQGYE